MDSRWVDAFAHKVKEVDSFMELRRKLGQRAKPAGPPPAAAAAKGGGKGKGKNGSKGKQSEAQQHAGQEAQE